MKKIILLVAIFSTICIKTNSQTFLNPELENQELSFISIEKIEISDYTYITLKICPTGTLTYYFNPHGHIKAFYIKDCDSGKEYKLKKLPINAPTENNPIKSSDCLTYIFVFKKLPKNVKKIDLIEGKTQSAGAWMNFYGIHLISKEDINNKNQYLTEYKIKRNCKVKLQFKTNFLLFYNYLRLPLNIRSGPYLDSDFFYSGQREYLNTIKNIKFEWERDCIKKYISGYGTLKIIIIFNSKNIHRAVITYSGNFIDGIPKGEFEITYKESLHGKSNTLFYKGEILNDLFEGKGKIFNTHCDGRYTTRVWYYSGDFSDGKFNGKGEIYINEELHNQGYFKDGEFIAEQMAVENGKATLEYDNGDVYIGEFKEYKRHGEGTIILNNGIEFSGRWFNNYPREGKIIYQDGSVFIGKIRTDYTKAEGVLLNNNGDTLDIGKWCDEKPIGINNFRYKQKITEFLEDFPFAEVFFTNYYYNYTQRPNDLLERNAAINKYVLPIYLYIINNGKNIEPYATKMDIYHNQFRIYSTTPSPLNYKKKNMVYSGDVIVNLQVYSKDNAERQKKYFINSKIIMHGKGTLFLNDGEQFFAEFDNNRLLVEKTATMLYNNGSKLTGYWLYKGDIRYTIQSNLDNVITYLFNPSGISFYDTDSWIFLDSNYDKAMQKKTEIIDIERAKYLEQNQAIDEIIRQSENAPNMVSKEELIKDNDKTIDYRIVFDDGKSGEISYSKDDKRWCIYYLFLGKNCFDTKNNAIKQLWLDIH